MVGKGQVGNGSGVARLGPMRMGQVGKGVTCSGAARCGSARHDVAWIGWVGWRRGGLRQGKVWLGSGEPEMDWSPEAKAAVEAPAGAVPPMTDAAWFVGNIDGDAA